MDTRDLYRLVRELSEEREDVINLYDSVDIELTESFVIETGVVGFTEDGIIIHLDEDAVEMLDFSGVLLESEQVEEGIKSIAAGIALLISAGIAGNKIEASHLMKTEPQLVTLAQMRQEAEQRGDAAEVEDLDDRIEKTLDHIRVTGSPVMDPSGKPADPRHPFAGESVQEAEYQGHEVPLNKPMQGDVKKSKVYVKKGDKVVKVNFGDPDMKIKKSNPDRRRSFRARHHCENPGPKWKARYWSCKAW